ncbi:MAG: alanine racemase [Rhodocyclales bacterium GWA2_65_20]|nr:MAG: alanine racemase [Rhodocyclales bacterium GWA2_65_20]
MPRPYFRPILAHIDLAALRHNHAIARRHAGGARIWSVVKADAYGHGLLRTAQALADVADGFALVEIEGAVALREAGVRQPILMLEGCYAPDELPLYAEHQLIPVLHRPQQVEWLVEAALPTRLPVYLKLNTGMNRLGFDADDFHAALATLKRLNVVSDITLMTHFSDADDERGIAEQMARLQTMRGNLPYPLCLANSAALLRFPEAVGDWVRPGIMLYGSSPFPDRQSAEKLGLAPVMTLESEVIAVRELAAGDRIGYGGTYTAAASMRVGIVACGYGDCYPRHAPSGTPVLVAGRRTRTVGRVSMDKLCVDLTEIPGAGVGSSVTLWGRGLSVDEVAASAGTISYELFCALAGRVPVLEEP